MLYCFLVLYLVRLNKDIGICKKKLSREFYQRSPRQEFTFIVKFGLLRIVFNNVRGCPPRITLTYLVGATFRDREVSGMDTIIPLEATAAYDMKEVITGVMLLLCSFLDADLCKKKTMS